MRRYFLGIENPSGLLMAAFFTAILLCVSVRSAGVTLVETVPRDAMAVVSWSGAQAQADAYQDSRLAQLAECTEWSQVGSMLKQLVATLGLHIEVPTEAGEALDHALAVASEMWQRQAVAWVMPPTTDGSTPPVVMVLIDADVDAGANDRFQDNLDALIALIPEEAKVARPSRMLLSGGETVLAWNATADVSLLASVSSRSWADRPGWKRATSGMLGPAAVGVGVDLKSVLTATGRTYDRALDRGHFAPDAPSWERLMAAFGTDVLGDLVWANGFVPGVTNDANSAAWTNRLWVETTGPRRGLLALLDSAELAPAHWLAQPDDADAGMIVALDPSELLSLVRKLADQFGPPDANEQIDRGLGLAKGALGIDLETELLDSLGTTWTLNLDPAAGGRGLLGATFRNEPRDAQTLSFTLDKLTRTGDGAIRMALLANQSPLHVRLLTENQRGVRLYRVGLPGISPSWTVHNDTFYFALQPESLVGAAQRADAGYTPVPETGSGSPAPLLETDGLRNGRIVYAAFVNLPQTAPGAHSSNVLGFSVLTGFAEMFTGRAMPRVIPTLPDVMPLLERTWCFAAVHPEGVWIESHQPFPASQMYGPRSANDLQLASMGVGVLLPALGAARNTAQQIQVTEQVRLIHRGLETAAVEHEKQTGEVLSYDKLLPMALERGYIQADWFLTPSSSTSVPNDIATATGAVQAAWLQREGDFVLVPGVKLNDPDDHLVGFVDPTRTGGRGTVMLSNDGATWWETDLASLDMLLQSQAGKSLDRSIQKFRAGAF